MSDLAGELHVVGSALVSPLSVTSAAHAFFAAAGVAPAAASLEGPMKGTFACPWIPEDSSPGVRMGVLAAQAVAAIVDGLPEAVRTRGAVEVVVVTPAVGQGISEEDVWLVERSVRTATHGARAATVRAARGPRAWLDELLRAGRELSQEGIRVLVGVDSPAHPARAAAAGEGQDSPWDPAPPRRSEAAAAIALSTPMGATAGKLPVLGRIRGAVTRQDDSTPDNDVPSDGGALSEAIAALAGRGVFRMVVGPRSISGFARGELELSVTRNVERFSPTFRPVCPVGLLGDVGLATLPAGLALGLAMLRHGTGKGPVEEAGPALVWDLFSDGTRLALSLEASLEPPPEHRATRALGAVARPRATAVRFRDSMAEARQGCLEQLAALGRLRKRAPWRELPRLEERILACLDALAEAGISHEEVLRFCGSAGESGLTGVQAGSPARRADEAGGFVAALVLGAVAGGGEERTRVLEESLVGMFGAEGEGLLEEETGSLHSLWLAAEGMFLSPRRWERRTLEEWLDRGSPVVAAAAVVVLAREKALSVERAERRARGGEPVVAAALARVSPLVPEMGIVGSEAVRGLLEREGALAWEGARGLLLAGDEGALGRVRGGDGLSARLGDRALTFLALAGERRDGELFGRLVRRLPRTEDALRAVGWFGDLALTPVLLDALEDPGTAPAARAALESMLGPAAGTEVPDRAEARAAWENALEQATWAQDASGQVRARDGQPWSVEGLVEGPGTARWSDDDWQFRLDEIRYHGKRPIPVAPGGFGDAAREAFVVALGEKRSAR